MMNDNTNNTDTPGVVTHSPGPWYYRESDDRSIQYICNDAAWIAEIENREITLAEGESNGRYIVECVNAHDRLTAERDWYRAALHGIARGHAVDPAAYAFDALVWVGDGVESTVDRLVLANAALVQALEAVQMRDEHTCPICKDFRLQGRMPGGHKSWCPMPKADAAIALAKGGTE